MAEESDEVVVRLQELSGRPLDAVRLRFARPVVAVREVNGAEEPAEVAGTGGFLPGAPAAPPALKGGAVELAFAPFRPRTLAVRLAPEAARLEPPVAVPLVLPWDLDGISRDEARKDGDFDGQGRSLAGELLPATVVSGGIPFRTGPQGPGEKNVLVARGQKLALPAGDFDRVYLVAAAIGGDRRAPFAVDGKAAALTVPDWAEPVGQWNNRMVGGARVDEADGIAPAYAKETPLAWVATHRHGARGENEAYAVAHLFRLRLDVPKGARELTLPSDERLRILAVTAARNPNDAVLSAQRFLDPGAEPSSTSRRPARRSSRRRPSSSPRRRRARRSATRSTGACRRPTRPSTRGRSRSRGRRPSGPGLSRPGATAVSSRRRPSPGWCRGTPRRWRSPRSRRASRAVSTRASGGSCRTSPR
ncbi:MAG: hypothetical protein IPF66_19005 [Holophagales bacterium]|nr:hypothetical protein [Holophagales bacterium]